MGARRQPSGSSAAAATQVHLGSSDPRRVTNGICDPRFVIGYLPGMPPQSENTTRTSEMPAVVLLSGGLDSYTAAAIAKAEGFRLYALTVRYGQRHAREIEAARRVAAALGV